MQTIGLIIGAVIVIVIISKMRKKPKTGNASKPPESQPPLPKEITDLAAMLKPGQMAPLQHLAPDKNGNPLPFITMVIKETDTNFKLIENNPNVEFMPGTIKYNGAKDIQLLCVLLRLAENEQLTYETGFSLANVGMKTDCEILGKQQTLQIIVVSESDVTMMQADISMFAIGLAAHARKIKEESKLDWTNEEYKIALQMVWNNIDGHSALWNLFKEHGQIIEVTPQNQ